MLSIARAAKSKGLTCAAHHSKHLLDDTRTVDIPSEAMIRFRIRAFGGCLVEAAMVIVLFEKIEKGDG
jgi:hypothetical protein